MSKEDNNGSVLDTSSLPIRQHEDQILAAVRSSPVTIITGETGSGKTTQLPQMLLDAPDLLGDADGAVAVTQPRRVAAISVARRVSKERNTRVGTEVGYAVRFEEMRQRDTRLTYLTDGTLLREMLSDPQLKRYRAVVLDEAHERSLNTDILFSLLKRLVAARRGAASGLPPLRVVVMSATMDTAAIAAFFGAAASTVLNVPGRQFPVTEVWAQEEHDKDYVTAAAEVAVEIHQHKPPGDILVFLSGQAEVDKAVKLIDQQVQQLSAESCGSLIVFGLYAAMPLTLQARVFQKVPEGTRRCIVATNIAETSITLDGVVFVVDSGVCKEKSYDCATGIERLQVQPISRVQAIQRGGRAGRTAPGECWRLYTKRQFDSAMADVSLPEILRVPLAGAVLHLKSLPQALGIDVLQFEFVDAPPVAAIEDALRSLHLLGAIDSDGGITTEGTLMAQIPLEPQLARALLASLDLGCASHLLTVASMLSVDTLFMSERPPSVRSAAEEARVQQKQQVLAELQADGVGDDAFLLRVAEVAGGPDADEALLEVLNINRRGLGFARKVREQLRRIVEGKVWPLYADHRHSAAEAGRGQQAGGEMRERSRSPVGDGRGGRSGESHSPAAWEGERRARGHGHASDQSGGERTGNRQRRGDGRGREGDYREALKRSGDTWDRGREEGRGQAREPCPALGMHKGTASVKAIRRLRHAMAIGFAPQVARRLDRNNGYRTLCAREQTVASIHQDCAKMATEDGLLPRWLVFHELVGTARTQLRKVCAVEAAWVAPVIQKLRDMETSRLGKSGAAAAVEEAAAAGGLAGEESAQAQAAREEKQAHNAERLEAARARAVARRAKGRGGIAMKGAMRK